MLGRALEGGWRIRDTHLEDVKESTAVEARLLVRGVHNRALRTLFREERGGEVELEALGHVVLELDLGAEYVRGSPGLGEDEAVGLVEVLGLDIADDAGRLVVAHASNLEGRR